MPPKRKPNPSEENIGALAEEIIKTQTGNQDPSPEQIAQVAEAVGTLAVNVERFRKQQEGR